MLSARRSVRGVVMLGSVATVSRISASMLSCSRSAAAGGAGNSGSGSGASSGMGGGGKSSSSWADSTSMVWEESRDSRDSLLSDNFLDGNGDLESDTSMLSSEVARPSSLMKRTSSLSGKSGAAWTLLL